MLQHTSTGKSGQGPHRALSCCSMMICRETTQAQDWAIYLPTLPGFIQLYLHLWGRQCHFPGGSMAETLLGAVVLMVMSTDRHGLASPRLQFHGSGHLWQCLESSICSFAFFFFWGAPSSDPSHDTALLGHGALADLQGHNVQATATNFTPSARHTWPSFPGDLISNPQTSCYFSLSERIGLLSG